ncbi:MAG: response regulator [Deltaproteobacteria bacterium]|nr:response regulator [Deltaproteobacteria bacterium]
MVDSFCRGLRVLVAEDDPVSAQVLERTLSAWGCAPLMVGDGDEAWATLQQPEAPRLAIIDWMMPGLEGLEVCRRVRAAGGKYTYLMLLTSRRDSSDIVAGLESGADDYITKPFAPGELRSRLRTGLRILELESRLALKVAELEKALAQVRALEGMIPICMYCKKVRNPDSLWQRVETYIEQHSVARFSHGLCDDCLAVHFPEEPPEPNDGADCKS